jgi:acetyltransferase-like isoleucine patch superfamily enzyme
MMPSIFYKLAFKLHAYNVWKFIIGGWYKLIGLHCKSAIPYHCTFFIWPHKTRIGYNCTIEQHVYFKHDGIYTSGKSIIIGNNCFIGAGTEFNIKQQVTIADNCLIASGCKFVDHNHGTKKGELMNGQLCPMAPIVVEEDVWIGANAVILMGVVIGKGAIVAAGAVVNKSIPPCEIWGGIPAKKIGERV